jgi:hypothetical protein
MLLHLVFTTENGSCSYSALHELESFSGVNIENGLKPRRRNTSGARPARLVGRQAGPTSKALGCLNVFTENCEQMVGERELDTRQPEKTGWVPKLEQIGPYGSNANAVLGPGAAHPVQTERRKSTLTRCHQP